MVGRFCSSPFATFTYRQHMFVLLLYLFEKQLLKTQCHAPHCLALSFLVLHMFYMVVCVYAALCFWRQKTQTTFCNTLKQTRSVQSVLIHPAIVGKRYLHYSLELLFFVVHSFHTIVCAYAVPSSWDLKLTTLSKTNVHQRTSCQKSNVHGTIGELLLTKSMQ